MRLSIGHGTFNANKVTQVVEDSITGSTSFDYSPLEAILGQLGRCQSGESIGVILKCSTSRLRFSEIVERLAPSLQEIGMQHLTQRHTKTIAQLNHANNLLDTRTTMEKIHVTEGKSVEFLQSWALAG